MLLRGGLVLRRWFENEFLRFLVTWEFGFAIAIYMFMVTKVYIP
jgi:hypothetical protein